MNERGVKRQSIGNFGGLQPRFIDGFWRADRAWLRLARTAKPLSRRFGERCIVAMAVISEKSEAKGTNKPTKDPSAP